MYERFFEMEHTPFVRNIPVDRLYTSKAIEEAVGRLKYTVDNKRFSVVMADPGCGKSTLMRMFVESLPKGEVHATLSVRLEADTQVALCRAS